MTDATVKRVPSEAEAASALARLGEMSADMRGAAIIAAGGSAIAATGDRDAWEEAAAELLAATDSAGSEPAQRAHVATEDGEAFVLREGDLAIVVAADRFALASLMLFDMRAVLRDLAPSAAGGSGAT